jgi:broad specificity phosphatase PhoE
MDGRWQGNIPIALNAEGHEQAHRLAAHLSTRSIAAIYSSDLPRAMETAVAIATPRAMQPRLDVRWQEINLGIFQGNTRQEMEMRFPAEWQAFHDQYWDYVVPNGESRRLFQDRLYAAWQQVLTDDLGPEVAVVTHGGAIRMLLLKLFPDDPRLTNLHIENTSVTTLDRTEQGWVLTTLTDAAHLASHADDERGESGAM